MPCRHGEVFWWDCPACEQQRKQDRRTAEFLEKRATAQREHETLMELKKIRRLLEEAEK